MANEQRLIAENDIYALFEENGTARLHVGHIDALPRVDAVEVVHGRWEIITDDYDCELMRCSVCKNEFYDGDNDTVDCLHNYCPNCGAKMDGGNEDG